MKTEKTRVSTGGAGDDTADGEQKKMLKGMRKHLKYLTSQPLFKNEMKTKYPTQMGKLPFSKIPAAGMASALTKVLEQKEKQKLKKNLPIKLKKQKKTLKHQQLNVKETEWTDIWKL